jgi:hypothetical protein
LIRPDKAKVDIDISQQEKNGDEQPEKRFRFEKVLHGKQYIIHLSAFSHTI